MVTFSEIRGFVTFSGRAAVALYFDPIIRLIHLKSFSKLFRAFLLVLGISYVLLLAFNPVVTIMVSLTPPTIVLLIVSAMVIYALATNRLPLPLRKICLPTDLQVSTPSGRIEVGKLAPDSLVWTLDVRNRRRAARRVTKIRVHSPTVIFKIELGGRPDFFATASHTVLSEAGWRRCGKLRAGDRLIIMPDSGGECSAEVISISIMCERKAVCSIRTAQDYNLVCDGVVTHNFTFFRRTRCALFRAWEALQRLSQFRTHIGPHPRFQTTPASEDA